MSIVTGAHAVKFRIEKDLDPPPLIAVQQRFEFHYFIEYRQTADQHED